MAFGGHGAFTGEIEVVFECDSGVVLFEFLFDFGHEYGKLCLFLCRHVVINMKIW